MLLTSSIGNRALGWQLGTTATHFDDSFRKTFLDFQGSTVQS